jgi:hypothetical protein
MKARKCQTMHTPDPRRRTRLALKKLQLIAEEGILGLFVAVVTVRQEAIAPAEHVQCKRRELASAAPVYGEPGACSINGESAGPPGVRGRLDLGMRTTTVGGVGVDLSGSYDGLGSRGYDAVTGKVRLRVPLN